MDLHVKAVPDDLVTHLAEGGEYTAFRRTDGIEIGEEHEDGEESHNAPNDVTSDFLFVGVDVDVGVRLIHDCFVLT